MISFPVSGVFWVRKEDMTYWVIRRKSGLHNINGCQKFFLRSSGSSPDSAKMAFLHVEIGALHAIRRATDWIVWRTCLCVSVAWLKA